MSYDSNLITIFFPGTKEHLCHAAATGTIANANEVPVLSFSEVDFLVFCISGGTSSIYIIGDIYKTVVGCSFSFERLYYWSLLCSLLD